MKAKNRKQKQEIYDAKYGMIPIDHYERLSYMYDTYNVSERMQSQIIEKRDAMLNALYYNDIIIQLFEVPEGSVRPRFRIIGKSNYHMEAISHPQYVHVYVPFAAEDNYHMKRLSNNELIDLNKLICTPCICEYCLFCQTPTAYNTIDKFLCELGLIRPLNKPDWDNAGKKYSDMSNHTIWIDDTMVIEGTVKKFYSILPRIEIRLRYQNILFNKHQYNAIINRKDYNEQTCMQIDYFK